MHAESWTNPPPFPPTCVFARHAALHPQSRVLNDQVIPELTSAAPLLVRFQLPPEGYSRRGGTAARAAMTATAGIQQLGHIGSGGCGSPGATTF
jgi:hypothetical protein